MIVCSCHVVSDVEVQAAAAEARTMAQVYRHLGHKPHCGRCAHSIREIMRDDGRERGAS